MVARPVLTGRIVATAEFATEMGLGPFGLELDSSQPSHHYLPPLHFGYSGPGLGIPNRLVLQIKFDNQPRRVFSASFVFLLQSSPPFLRLKMSYDAADEDSSGFV